MEHSYIYSLYNKNNKLITNEYIEDILNIFGVKCKIKNLDRFITATTHKSFNVNKEEFFKESKDDKMNEKYEKYIIKNKLIELRENDYERMEFLGDSIGNSIIVNYIYNRFTQSEEGNLTDIKNKLIQSKTLAVYCKQIKLNDYLLMCNHTEEKYGRDYQSFCEDIFEAFICALFLEIGYDKTTTFMVNVMERYTDWEYIVVYNENFKNTLFRHYQRNGLAKPHFKQISYVNNEYTISVLNEYKQILGTGKGNTKKIAEQQSCKMALQYMNNNVV